ncbi:hypothetical protein OG909_32725 (plasmid) [Streptomyces sp. NBC_01754]|uniref:hypothetical protein n=1 Tax=Streptomyces sp. NBC_01754 TaxID=2975930 RepID=UPI002DDB2057|nr:hypothetical protein [Streptomyces sp. NBC_01754]WSC97071.1 hypothetical protein OG909_32725 [Streptomyces sp. NBC_01754]
MIQHMNLVFQAGGLKTGEGAFLMACANHTDNRGYVIAHMKQLADEAHMTLRAAQDNRARLEARGLLKSKERLNPKNRAQMANLFRINLDKLAAMKRSKTDYGPTLIEELTFDAANTPPEENPSSDPHADSAPPPADSAPPHAESAGDGGAESAPLLLPSSSPSSLSGRGRPTGDAPESGEDEREAAAPGPVGADVVVAAYAEAFGRPLVNGSRQRLRGQAVQLLAAGYPVEWLAARAAEMPANGWRDLVQHAESSRVPVPGQAGPGRGAGGTERCPDHPARYRKGCLDCALAVPA